jgi:hypothetical protein
MEDHPTIRTLFYIGLFLATPLLYFINRLGDPPWSIVVLLLIGILAYWIIKQTRNFRNWHVFSGPLTTRLASLASIYIVLMGGAIVTGTIIFLPWLLNGIRQDLRN